MMKQAMANCKIYVTQEGGNSIQAPELLRRWQTSLYFTLPNFIGSEPLRKTNMQSKGMSRHMTYLIKMIKTGK